MNWKPRERREQRMIANRTRLGPYEIVAPLGVGGMGEVYRARDTRSPGQFSSARGYTSNFDPHPDGKRFAVLKAPATGDAPKTDKVSFVFNFFGELRSKVPPREN